MVIKVKYNGEWVKIPYLSSDHNQELVEEAPKDGKQYARQNGVWSVVNIPEVDFTEVYNAIDTKVDKVEGKGLSTNDYVTADKTKVTNINKVIEAATKNITATDISITLDKRNLVTNVVENIELNLPASTTALAGLMLPSDKTKLNGIAAGAEVNVNADWNATKGDAQILNKPTLATVATSGSYKDLTGKPTIPTVDVNKKYVDDQLATKADLEVYNAIDTKVDKVEGKGLSTNDYVTADKTKVTNINKVIEAATKNITATDISITLDKRNLVTNVVENIELNLPASTTALAGLMLPSDKTKLNGIAAGAEVNVNADWNATKGDAQILNKPTLATVATSGSYKDLTGKPTIPTVDVNKKYVDDQLATKADLADYTVFDIFMKVASGDTPSISQEDYNTLLEKVPNGFVNTLPIRDNDYYVSSLFGGYNANGDNSIWFYAQQTMGVNHCSIQMWIRQNLDVETQVNNDYLIPVTDGISIQASITDPYNDPNVKEVIIHTTGDGSKALMDDGKYRKLPVYGRNLLLGSGKEVSNSKYEMADYWLTEQISKGTQVTLTIFGELGDDKEMFTIYNSTGAVGSMAQFSKADFVNGKASKTFKWITNIGDAVADNTHIIVFSSPKTGTSISTIHKIKLEYGDISTEWSPAWEDIPDLEERYAYGVEWDTASSSPDGVRVGNIQLHRELPVQSKMRRCLLDRDGGVKEYLDNELSWGGSYLDYAVMTEIPEHWYKLYFNGTKFRMMLSEIPLPGYKHVDKFYISTYEARMYRTDNLLCSAAGASKLSDPNSINFRGGDNTAEWDDTYRSLLGCPVTNLTRDQFRQAARKRGSGWEMYTYGAHKTLFWLFAVEYATLNSQKPFNAQKDANGFSQGGLGLGSTQMTDWANFNNTNPLIPCGYTNEFGNGSGEKAYVVKNASGGTHATLMANRYRGIENPFGHMWKYTDGVNIQVTTGDAGLSVLWTTDDPSNFSDTSYTGYDKKGNIYRTNGYAKRMLLGEDGDIVVTDVGGSSSTYWCGYYYTYTSINRMLMVRVGGDADRVSDAGLTCVAANLAPSDGSRNSSSRLCFFPKYKSTEITTTIE